MKSLRDRLYQDCGIPKTTRKLDFEAENHSNGLKSGWRDATAHKLAREILAVVVAIRRPNHDVDVISVRFFMFRECPAA
ncbi:MAG: hypothetical protein AUH87_00450 [Deltaproteobacteria bacterium 13_1_40CM_4_54_4]|nr:MAG: hypothetical protein AUH87_00450 [Deltaproteobacteria bacterium 13_1_40CM_4_54_4]